jgi:hypothetical protein
VEPSHFYGGKHLSILSEPLALGRVGAEPGLSPSPPPDSLCVDRDRRLGWHSFGPTRSRRHARPRPPRAPLARAAPTPAKPQHGTDHLVVAQRWARAPACRELGSACAWHPLDANPCAPQDPAQAQSAARACTGSCLIAGPNGLCLGIAFLPLVLWLRPRPPGDLAMAPSQYFRGQRAQRPGTCRRADPFVAGWPAQRSAMR